MAARYQPLGPLLAGEGSRAFLGLEISEGGQASPVVLVWVPEEAQKDPAALARLRAETEHAAILEHPNIVNVRGFASLDEGHARVVEFADGESLRKILETAGRLSVELAAKVVADAATGVHYAHVAGNDDGTPLVHGDLRPETILIAFSGVTKVTGYGALAFAPREHGGQRVRGRRVHTAPEQIIGGRSDLRVATDVYLLGLMLYECITGAVPFADQGDFFDQAVLTLPLTPATPGLIPEAIDAVIQKACAKKVTERYPTALAFREALVAAAGTLPANDALGLFLGSVFPRSAELRQARRQAIDGGIADFVRRQWAEQAAAPPRTVSGAGAIAPAASAAQQGAGPGGPTPAAVPASSEGPSAKAASPSAAERPTDGSGARGGAAPQGATTGAPRSAAPAPSDRGSPSTLDDDPPSSNRGVWLGLGALALAGAGVAFAVSQSSRPLPATERVIARVDAGQAAAPVLPPTPIATEDASVALAPAAVPDSGSAATPDAGAAAATPADAGAAKANGRLELKVTPNVEVTLEGVVLGKTPLSVELPPGRKVLQLANKDLGLSTSRVVVIEAGETDSEVVTLGTGVLVVNAPAGAIVFIDGRRIGPAPVTDQTLYEGAHRLLVTVGKARFAQAFTLFAGQKVKYDVELQ